MNKSIATSLHKMIFRFVHFAWITQKTGRSKDFSLYLSSSVNSIFFSQLKIDQDVLVLVLVSLKITESKRNQSRHLKYIQIAARMRDGERESECVGE